MFTGRVSYSKEHSSGKQQKTLFAIFFVQNFPFPTHFLSLGGHKFEILFHAHKSATQSCTMNQEDDAMRITSAVRFMCSRLFSSSTQRSYSKKVIASEPIAMAGLFVKSSNRTYKKDELAKAIADRVKHNIDVAWDNIFATPRLDGTINWPQTLSKDALNRTTESVRESLVACVAMTARRPCPWAEYFLSASSELMPPCATHDVSLLQPRQLEIQRTPGLRNPILR